MDDLTIDCGKDTPAMKPVPSGASVDDITYGIAVKICDALLETLTDSNEPPILWLVQKTGLDRRMVNRVLNGDPHIRMDEFIISAAAVGLDVEIVLRKRLDNAS